MNVIAVVYVVLVTTGNAFKYNDYDAIKYNQRPLLSSSSSLSSFHGWFYKQQDSPKGVQRKTETATFRRLDDQIFTNSQIPINETSFRGDSNETERPKSDSRIVNAFRRRTHFDVSLEAVDPEICPNTKLSNGNRKNDGKCANTISQLEFVRKEGQVIPENMNGMREISEGRATESDNTEDGDRGMIGDKRNVLQARSASERYSDIQTETDVQTFLDQLKKKVIRGELEKLLITGYREGRRRKFNSQQQGTLLVEALRKKRNRTEDHRGQNNNLQASIMDMLGRSMFCVKPFVMKDR